MAKRIRIAVLISGEVTNLQALMDACESGDLTSCTIVSVVSNHKNARGLLKAEEASIPTFYHGIVDYKKAYENMELAKYKYDQDLASVALSEDPDLIVCAGFTRDLGPSFIDSIAAFTIPAINLHPSLPPADLIENNDAMSDAHRRLKEQGISSTGAMVHEINKRPGRGRPFSWEMIEFEDARDERVETLRERIQRVERKVIVEGTRNAIEFYGLPKTSISPPF